MSDGTPIVEVKAKKTSPIIKASQITRHQEESKEAIEQGLNDREAAFDRDESVTVDEYAVLQKLPSESNSYNAKTLTNMQDHFMEIMNNE